MSTKKVYLHTDEKCGCEFTAKVVVDASQTVTQVIEKFVSLLNSKHPDTLKPNHTVQLKKGGKILQANKALFPLVDDGDDIEVNIIAPDPNTVLTCTRPGCGKQYTEAENTPGSCWYHPKGPIFHEGLKGWSCCSKRVVSFDEFMNIPGCTPGQHTSEKPNKPLEPIRTTVPQQPASVATSTSTSSTVETYKFANTPELPAPAVMEEPPKPPEVENDPEDAVIAIGTPCKRHGCKATYQGEASKTEVCIHHPGDPVFHEGTKYWSCCSKHRAAEFEEFLRIEGCTEGRHKFLPFKKDVLAADQVKVRHDFYAIGADTICVNFYAKNLNKAASTVTYTEDKLIVHLIFNDGKKYDGEFELYKQIDPAQSKHEFLTTKVEIKLRKKEPAQWPRLVK